MSVLDAATEVEQLQPDEAPPEPAPQPSKRRPGRPRKDGLPPGTVAPKRARRGSRAQIRESMAMLVGCTNLAVSFTRYRADCLTDPEMDLLTDALVAEVSASERIGGWLGKAAALSPHVLLVQAIVRIALPRLQRHGILPAGALAVPPGLEARVHDMAANGASQEDVLREIQNYARQRAEAESAESTVSMAAG